MSMSTVTSSIILEQKECVTYEIITNKMTMVHQNRLNRESFFLL